ncbi:LacI family transcriptional regulator [Gibbsiella quercinecans]|uniref:LacI family transcriptional regulator n=1 Tax=Gibbsiella quercinecans TaxID=929813 RepID=A0A250AWA9_9GAMM|nr:LacI family DNA-binding transcriptional regulator [Gibbsiella quercinecans]ATA18248.1 LacI family transcriptional regulator [Gibbsiella quercinecans]RLM10544.1 LacI family transcriptional regulator [Gibbsiella quercinecans]RLM12973.1 LacI family transcriptional regulator [Gibbsiella quercinecans]RLM14541.1 LacI family transcriptional regulator [Gibbsiella quercinecans]TCT90823.1 LacI family transcriptional regulator [Gibbsiella quercinecans]
MAITIKDVALKAGVATSTVSRVINDSANISEKTKERVNRIMQDLGYTPNSTARSLGKGKANAIAIILPPLKSREEMSIPFFLEFIESVNTEAQKFGLSVALAVSKNFDELLLNVKRMHDQKQVDGFILFYSNIEDPVIEYLHKNKFNFTLTGMPCKNEDSITYVDNDNQLLGKHATDYLIKNGHKKILFITNRIKENVHFERYFGYQKALLMQDLIPFDAIDIEKPQDLENIGSILKETKATAVVIIEDLLAFKVIKHLEYIGYAVPQNISVISFNNTIFSTLSHPYITTIDINVDLLAKYSLKHLVEQINGKKSHGMKFVVPHRIVENESVAKLSDNKQEK